MFDVFWSTSYHVSSSKDVWWPYHVHDVSVSHNRFNSYHMFEVVSSARRVRASNCTSSDLVSQICRSNCSTWKELMSQGNDFKWFQAYLSTWFLQKAATTWGVDRMLLSSVGRNMFCFLSKNNQHTSKNCLKKLEMDRALTSLFEGCSLPQPEKHHQIMDWRFKSHAIIIYYILWMAKVRLSQSRTNFPAFWFQEFCKVTSVASVFERVFGTSVAPS